VPDVNATQRQYSSPLRRRQAAETRAAVLAAARELFLEQGYGATTVDQVAARAGVSKPTVFTAVGNKQSLLKVVRDVAMAGDDAPVPVAVRPASVETEPDLDRAVDLITAHLAGVSRRYAGIDNVLRGAAESGEPELRELWFTSEQQRLAGARQWVAALSGKGAFAPGVDEDSAVDTMWLLMAPDHYHRLVMDRGWDENRYRAWVGRQIRALFV
jgi:AcrR family transcriptional regulator